MVPLVGYLQYETSCSATSRFITSNADLVLLAWVWYCADVIYMMLYRWGSVFNSFGLQASTQLCIVFYTLRELYSSSEGTSGLGEKRALGLMAVLKCLDVESGLCCQMFRLSGRGQNWCP